MVQRGDGGYEEGRRSKVKFEVDGGDEGELGLIAKRAKPSSSPIDQRERDIGSTFSPIDPTLCNHLDEPSPLGLHLRKSPSLLDLIQMRLSQESSATLGVNSLIDLKKTDIKGCSATATAEKLKASNFAASLLRIGKWERTSKYEGDLVAKCYYAKHKIVWEVLDSGLKNKIEIQWSDITSLKASFPDDGPATLDIVLARQPLFFKETNPQPRKHTLWHATTDFTGGQASIHRRHFLQCPQGLLNKHFDKLIQCDPRLKLLSQLPNIDISESPFFETKSSIFDDPVDLDSAGFDCPKDEYMSSFPQGRCARFPSTSQASSEIKEIQDKVYRTHDAAPNMPVFSSGVLVDDGCTNDNGGRRWEEPKNSIVFNHLKTAAFQSSMSVTEWVSQLGHLVSEQMVSGNPFFSANGEGYRKKEILEEISQYLLSDSQLPSASDEQSLMTRVNSLCSLLQLKDSAVIKNSQIKSEAEVEDALKFAQKPVSSSQNFAPSAFSDNVLGSEVEVKEGESGRKQQSPAMSRKDSIGDFFLHLPRIASLPQFLFNITEENNNQAR